jgi:hypothetical protein
MERPDQRHCAQSLSGVDTYSVWAVGFGGNSLL